MININLLDYKRIAREVTIQKQLTKSVGIILLVIVACGLHWMLKAAEIGVLEGEIAEVEAQVAELSAEYNQVQALREEEGKLTTIITGIDDLRSRRSRTTEILEDVGHSLPEDIWLERLDQMTLLEVNNKKIPFIFLSQAKGEGKKENGKKNQNQSNDQFFELKGTARNEQSVVHFLEQLRAIPYLDHVLLYSTKHQLIGFEEVKKFVIYCHVLNPEEKA
jgi:Tfp pilus assembly protein PilN